MATTTATNEASSVDDCLMVEVIPRMVAIAPGPHISGIASGTKAIFASCFPPPAGMIPPPDFDGEKSSKPIFIKIMPPTIRTIANGITEELSNVSASSVVKVPMNNESSRPTVFSISHECADLPPFQALTAQTC